MPIVTAFLKLIRGENTELSKARLKVCAPCEERCGILCCNCGCYLKAKTSDEEEFCPFCVNCLLPFDSHDEVTKKCSIGETTFKGKW